VRGVLMSMLGLGVLRQTDRRSSRGKDMPVRVLRQSGYRSRGLVTSVAMV
jgi:hypothetical protein